MKTIIILLFAMTPYLCQAQVSVNNIIGWTGIPVFCGGTDQKIFLIEITNSTDSVLVIQSLSIVLDDTNNIVEKFSLYRKDSFNGNDQENLVSEVGSLDGGFSGLNIVVNPKEKTYCPFFMKVTHGKTGSCSVLIKNTNYFVGTQQIRDTSLICAGEFKSKNVNFTLSAENFSDTLTRIQLDTTNLLDWAWYGSNLLNFSYNSYLYVKPDVHFNLTMHISGCAEKITLYTEPHLYFTAWWYSD